MIFCLEYSKFNLGHTYCKKNGIWNIPVYSKIYLGHTKLPSIWDIGINNFHYVFHMTEEMGISVYCVFTPYLYKKFDYLISTNDFGDGK